MNTVVFETANFVVEAVTQPLVDRDDGGHLVINPKIRIETIQQLTPLQAIELTRLTMVVGEALTMAMNKQGVDIGRINYQDNGNWGVFKPDGPYCHIHIYGRAKSAKYQKYGQALHFPHREEQPSFYEHLKPLNLQDIKSIGEEIVRLLGQEKYSDKNWRLLKNDF
jgi:diadenosine tetraphosphate (Ap4A) HIT family hydrolase